MKNFKKIAISLIAVTFLANCTTDAYTGEKQASKTAVYGLGGAAAGALAGYAIGGDAKSAAIGAGVGGAAGAGTGYYFDRQEAKLRQQLLNSGVQVQRNGDDIKLIMPGDITFDVNQYNIKSSFYPTLDSIILVLKEFDKTAVQITGHTDSTGNATSNQTLSEQRARSVADYFSSQGVKRGRIKDVGYGHRYPVATNDTAAGKAKNRRVEITIQPL